MNKFKLASPDIDLSDDILYNKAYNLLSVNNAIIIGSYLKYGKTKSGDIDFEEKIQQHNKKEVLINYFKKLQIRKKEFKLVELAFDIKDERINRIINNIGYLDGLMNIKAENISLDMIAEDLPIKIKNKINKLMNNYLLEKNLNNYLKLFKYLKSKNQLKLKIEDAIVGIKKYNGKDVNIYDYNFGHVFIEIILDNYKVSSYILLREEQQIIKGSIILFDLENAIIKTDKKTYEIFYYKIIKYFLYFLKKHYFMKTFKEHNIISQTINIYNNIYDYRNELGSYNYEICMLENLIKLKKGNNIELIDKYNKLLKEFNNKCKKYFEEISQLYRFYLNNNFRLN